MLGALSALWVWSTVLCFTPLLAGKTNLMRWSAVFSLLSAAATAVAILFSAKLLLHESSLSTDRFRKLWFLPAILLAVVGMYGFLQTVALGYPGNLQLFSVFSILLNGVTYFLLFRWLAYPYAQTAMPVGQTPVYAEASPIQMNPVSGCADSGSPVSAASFAFCPACGQSWPKTPPFARAAATGLMRHPPLTARELAICKRFPILRMRHPMDIKCLVSSCR